MVCTSKTGGYPLAMSILKKIYNATQNGNDLSSHDCSGMLCIASFPPRYTIRFPRENDGESYGTPFQQIFKLLGTHSNINKSGSSLGGGSTAAAANPSGTETFSARNHLPPPMGRDPPAFSNPIAHDPWSFASSFAGIFFCKLGHVSSVKQWCISGIFRGQDLFWEFGKKIKMSLLQSVEQQKPYVFGPFHD